MTELNSQNVNKEELVDIRSVVIDTSLPVPEKIKSYHRQIKNHRLFLHEDTVVRVSFAEGGASMKDLLALCLLSGQGAKLTSD
jgi:hypothetical protein